MRRIFLLLIVIFAPYAFAGELYIRHAVGGRAQTLVINGDYWYQAVGGHLKVIRSISGEEVASVLLAEYIAGGECTDLQLNGNMLFALLEGDQVVVLDCKNPAKPNLITRLRRDILGIIPKGIENVGSWVVAFGKNGAVRLPDCTRLVTCEDDVSSVSKSIEKGLIYSSNSKIFEAKTNGFCGAGSIVLDLDQSANATEGTLVAIHSKNDTTNVRLITPQIADINIKTASLSFRGEIAHAQAIGSRVFISTPSAMHIIGVAPNELRLLKTVLIQGVQDVGIISSNYLAVCGDFGWAVYRMQADRGGSGDFLFRKHVASSSFKSGRHDNWGVVIPMDSGSAYYRYESEIEYRKDFAEDAAASKESVALGWRAAIDPATDEVFMIDSKDALLPLPIPKANVIISVSGNFWIGTTDGLYVFGDNGEGKMVELASISIAGSIVQLIPLLDDNAAFISDAGFAGVVELSQVFSAFEQ